jgi:hypothetical protein
MLSRIVFYNYYCFYFYILCLELLLLVFLAVFKDIIHELYCISKTKNWM